MGKPSPFDKLGVNDLWKKYKKDRSEELRNFLMEKYLHLVRFNAERSPHPSAPTRSMSRTSCPRGCSA